MTACGCRCPFLLATSCCAELTHSALWGSLVRRFSVCQVLSSLLDFLVPHPSPAMCLPSTFYSLAVGSPAKSQALNLPQTPGSCLWAIEQSWSSPLSLSHCPFLLLGMPSLPSHGSLSHCVTHPSTALPALTCLRHFWEGRPLGPSLLLLLSHV